MDYKQERRGNSISEMDHHSPPQIQRRLGEKNAELFSKAIASKYMWHMIENPESLWGSTMRVKYYRKSLKEEQFILLAKTHKGGSICWKSLVLEFPLIRNWVAWKIGNGRSIHIGWDPWVGSGENFRLTNHLITQLVDRGVRMLADASSQTEEHRGTVSKTTQELGFEENEAT